MIGGGEAILATASINTSGALSGLNRPVNMILGDGNPGRSDASMPTTGETPRRIRSPPTPTRSAPARAGPVRVEQIDTLGDVSHRRPRRRLIPFIAVVLARDQR